MGMRTRSFVELGTERAGHSDVVSSQTKNDPEPSGSFEAFVSRNFPVVKLGANQLKTALVLKKWAKAITALSSRTKAPSASANRWLTYLNSAVRSTLQYLKNSESVLMLMHIFHDRKNDGAFLDSAYRLALRWFCCLKYGLHLAEFPHVASLSAFHCFVWGIASLHSARSQLCLWLLDLHNTADGQLFDILQHNEPEGDMTKSPIKRALELFPALSEFEHHVEPKPLCQEVSSFILGLFMSTPPNMHAKYDSSEAALEELWEKIEDCAFKDDCDCRQHAYVALVDTYTAGVFRTGLLSETFDKSLGRLVDLYGRLLAELTPAKDTNSTPVRVKLEPGVARGVLAGDSERARDWALTSLSRFVEHCMRFFGNFGDVPPPVWSLVSAFMELEGQELRVAHQALGRLRSPLRTESLRSTLLRHRLGREFLNALSNLNCLKCPDLHEYANRNEGNCMDRLAENCYRFYSAVASGANMRLGDTQLKLCASADQNLNDAGSAAFLDLSQEFARDVLGQLLECVERQKTGASNIQLDADGVAERHDLQSEAREFMAKTSPVAVAMAALASAMSDDVLVECSGGGVVRLLFGLRAVYSTDPDMLRLVAGLLYAEIADDRVMALEYRDCELALYRTMLLRYLLQLALSPIPERLTLGAGADWPFDFTQFTLRLFKFLNFRANYALMDRVVFEKFLTTRVVSNRRRNSSPCSPTNSDSPHANHSNGVRNGSAWDPVDDGPGDVSADAMLESFGFLEYRKTGAPSERPGPALKSDDAGQTEAYFEPDEFFRLAFRLCGALRHCVIGPRRYGADVVDQLMFRQFLRLCASDFYDAANTNVIYANIRRVVDTNELGEKLESQAFANYFGAAAESNDLMESLELLNNRQSLGHGAGTVQLIDLLRLNNRYTKRAFYKITHRLAQELFASVPTSCIATLVCSWASALPVDPTSAVRAEKIATARFLLLVLTARMCAAGSEVGLRVLAGLEPLVSAANVVFVNLELVHKGPKAFGLCEVVSDDEELYSPERCNFLTQDTIDLSDENFYENAVSNFNSLRAESVRKLNERRETVRRRTREEVGRLLQAACLLAGVLDAVARALCALIADPANSFVTQTGECALFSDSGAVVSCIGKKRALVYSAADFLALVDNTLTTAIRICMLATLNVADDGPSTDSVKRPAPKDEPGRACVKLEPHAAPAEPGPSEMAEYAALIGSLKSLKHTVKARLDALAGLKSSEEPLGPCDSQSPGRGQAGGAALGGAPAGPADDLEDFIDFETDQHLSMVTYSARTRALAAKVGCRHTAGRLRQAEAEHVGAQERVALHNQDALNMISRSPRPGGA